MEDVFALVRCLCLWGGCLGTLYCLRRRGTGLVRLFRLSPPAPGRHPTDMPGADMPGKERWPTKFIRIGRALADLAGNRPRPLEGLAHLLVVLSFVLTARHTLFLLGRGLLPLPLPPEAFWPSYLGPGFDLFGIWGGIGGVCFLAFRKWQRQAAEAPADWRAFAVHGLILGVLLTLLPLPCAPAPWGEVAAALHLALVLLFTGYALRATHTHLVAAPFSLWQAEPAVFRALPFIPITDESRDSFGLGGLCDADREMLCGALACMGCGRCDEVCPARRAGGGLSPRLLVARLRDRVTAASDWRTGETKDPQGRGEREALVPLFDDETPLPRRVLWECSTCLACEKACPVGVRHVNILAAARAYQVLTLAEAPTAINRLFDNMERTGGPLGLPPAPLPVADAAAVARDPAELLQQKTPREELVLFAGSFMRTHPAAVGALEALWKLLLTAGLAPRLLQPGESGGGAVFSATASGRRPLDTGDDLRRTGNDYLAEPFRAETMAALEAAGNARLVCPCPHSLNSLRREYPRSACTAGAVHHSVLLADLVSQGRLRFSGEPAGQRVVYHDPCYLSRWLGETDAPRRLLAAANQGRAPLEAAETGSRTLCCGGGGGLAYTERPGTRMSDIRLQSLLATGAGIIVTACPFCRIMLGEAAARAGSGVPVLDIAEYLATRRAR